METFSIRLGQSVNLLDGYSTTVFLERGEKCLLKETPKEVLPERVPLSPISGTKWDDYPEISLHSTSEELITAIQSVRLRKISHLSREGSMPKWLSGSLILANLNAADRTAALSHLSEEIGVPLDKTDLSFALVRWSRKSGTALHPCYESGLVRLADSVQIDPEAQRVCNYWIIVRDAYVIVINQN